MCRCVYVLVCSCFSGASVQQASFSFAERAVWMFDATLFELWLLTDEGGWGRESGSLPQ